MPKESELKPSIEPEVPDKATEPLYEQIHLPVSEKEDKKGEKKLSRIEVNSQKLSLESFFIKSVSSSGSAVSRASANAAKKWRIGFDTHIDKS